MKRTFVKTFWAVGAIATVPLGYKAATIVWQVDVVLAVSVACAFLMAVVSLAEDAINA